MPKKYLFGWDEKGQTKNLKDEQGVAGQGNANPHSLFANHVVAQLTVGGVTMLYDPSYGIIYSGVAALDLDSIAYYGKAVPVKNKDDEVISYRIVFKVNPVGSTDLKRDNRVTTYKGEGP